MHYTVGNNTVKRALRKCSADIPSVLAPFIKPEKKAQLKHSAYSIACNKQGHAGFPCIQ